jgi:hypothetical protein
MAEEKDQEQKPKTLKSIGDLTPDQENADEGTDRGQFMLEQSLRFYGAGRSVVADRDGTISVGNKTVEGALQDDEDVVDDDPVPEIELQPYEHYAIVVRSPLRYGPIGNRC